MTYVYILSDYEEDGAEHVTATLDRSRILHLVDENWPNRSDEEPHIEYMADFRSRAKAKLTELLRKSDSELIDDYGWNCQDGWGGIQLHVVELK